MDEDGTREAELSRFWGMSSALTLPAHGPQVAVIEPVFGGWGVEAYALAVSTSRAVRTKREMNT